jgi:hypothetical protein
MSMTGLSEKHYVAYHSVDERGSHLNVRSGGGVFETNKSALPSKGDVLWCFEGEGKPKRYQLMMRGIVTRITRHDGEASLVYYHGPADFSQAEVTSFPWFEKLAKSQGSFSFGLNSIRDPEAVEELERFVAGQAASEPRYTDLCAYTIRHSSSLEEFSDGGSYTVDTGGRIWARIATLMAERQPGEVVPVLFAPARTLFG